MTPKEKAEELFDKFRVKVHDRNGTSAMNGFEAKQCALIAIDEILDLKHIVTLRRNMHEMELDFWDEVKEEIEKL
jgi:hypothetical protein